MMLKICYGHGLQKYIMNVTSCTFTSHMAEDPIRIDPASSYPFWVVCSKEHLKEGFGCTRYEHNDCEYYMNYVSVHTKDILEETNIAFTGVAYLCDDNGKTVDTLR